MRESNHILSSAVAALQESINLEITTGRFVPADALLKIGSNNLIVEIKRHLTVANKGIILSIIKESQQHFNFPIVLITDYMPQNIATEYRNQGINYLDTSGNCSIKTQNLILHIEGKKKNNAQKINQSRAFQEAGIKIIFHFLNKPETINYTFRELAKTAEVSLGSVASVIQELTELNFYMKTSNGKFLTNKIDLLQRWVIAYHDVLRPRLLLKKMRFTKIRQNEWELLSLMNADDTVLWGGEPAGSILTGHLYPGKFTIYTNGFWKSLISDLHLAPSEDGEIEVLRMFWDQEDGYFEKQIVSPLLIYADLMGSGNDRNIETAKIILDHELSYIQ